MKSKEDERLIDITDKAIHELVFPKYDLQKAYNYYNGKRDAQQFRYLEENYGLGNPTAVEFIPLIRKHIDALVGEYLGMAIIPKVTCKDSGTIYRIEQEKKEVINDAVKEEIKARLTTRLQNYMQTGDEKELQDTDIQKDIQHIIDTTQESFTSKFEIAAQHIIEYLMQSREADLMTKLKTLLLDLLITGYTFFRSKPTVSGNNVTIEVLNPLNTFIDKNPESPYIKDSYRAVVRKWLTKNQILNIYGVSLSQEDIKQLEENWDAWHDESYYYVRGMKDAAGMPATDGILAGEEVIPGYPDETYSVLRQHLIPVYEVEWIETDEDFIMQRYSTIRIGESIYILNGKDEHVVRSMDHPDQCSLTLNGVYFVNRNNEPYSLMLACASLQDKYDLLHFYRDNLIAQSGTVGDFVDLAMLPKVLGVNLPERLEKWKAYKKGGTALLDSSQEGNGVNNPLLNTIFNGYDDTVKVQAVQAIQLAIQSVEETVCTITGVFRERLNGIEQRDAVTNVKQGVNNSFIITKQYYQQMDLVAVEMLTDALNLAKRVYRNGMTGTIILGNYKKTFTALPENFTFTDYDIHITSASDTAQDMDYVRQIIPNFIQSGAMSPEIIFEAVNTKSLSDLQNKVKVSMAKAKEENNQLQMLAEQVKQYEAQLKEISAELKKSQTQVQKLNEAKLKLEQEKIQSEGQINWYKAQTERTYREDLVEEQKRRTQLEMQQMYDRNPYNDKIRKLFP